MPIAEDRLRRQTEGHGMPYMGAKIAPENASNASLRGKPEGSGGSLLFAGLPTAPRNRWTCFGTSLILQAAVAVMLIEVVMFSPVPIISHRQNSYIALAPYVPPINHEPQQVPEKLLKAARPAPAAEKAPEVAKSDAFPAPVVIRPAAPKSVEAEVKPPTVKLADNSFPAMAQPHTMPKLAPQVRTGNFSTGSSETPTAMLSPSKVQTGGFGDPNGLPPSQNTHGPANIAQAGSFDLPAGPGHGNGSGGSAGARAVVPSAGFGNGTATAPVSRHASGTVQAVNFTDSTPAAPSAPRTKTEKLPDALPVEVLSKPTPAYTAEARALHLEGEVLLEVVFTASGSLRVVRVVRGLGHGLDEAAVRAAEQIRFKPATRGGVPVDSSATLHIVFQLT